MAATETPNHPALPTPPSVEPQLSFEEAADALEALVESMENEVLPLEQMLAHYERGVTLARHCADRLSAAEKRIEIIRRRADGAEEITPLDPDTAEAEEASPGPAARTKRAAAPRRADSPAQAQAAPAMEDPDSLPDDDDELALF